MNYRRARVRAEILKALAHPARILIVDALSTGDACVSDLNRLIHLDQSGISRHLAVLKRAGIVTERRLRNRAIQHLHTPCILQALECAATVLQADARRRLAVLRDEAP